MDLSIVIVNFNTKKLCSQTVKSIFDTTCGVEYEIIIADNSTDKNEVFVCSDERVRVFSGLPNRGFGTASNYGAKKAVGKYILFLNSDTIMQRDTLRKALCYMKEHPETGCLGIKTLLKDGGFDHGCKRGFPTPFNAFCYFVGLDRLFPKNKAVGGYRLTYINKDETAFVDCVSGAFMLMPREVFYRTGGFDENIFMHGEDIDLCHRISLLNKRVVYFADAYIVHLKGGSGQRSENKESLFGFYEGILYVYDKYYGKGLGKAASVIFHGGLRTMRSAEHIKQKLKKRLKAQKGGR